MNRTFSVALLVASLLVLLCLTTEASVNPFQVLKNYHSHIGSKLVSYKNTFRKNHHTAIQHAARGSRSHFSTFSDLNGTFDVNSTDDYDFDDPESNLTDVSPACFTVWSTYLLPNLEAIGQCGIDYVALVTDPNLQNQDLNAYCNSAQSCYSLFDDLLVQFYEHCSDQDLDNLDLNGLSFSQLRALTLPCFQNDANQSCFAETIRMTHTLLSPTVFQSVDAAQLTTLLNSFCTPCVLDLLWELSQTTGPNEDEKSSYFVLSNMCLKDGDTFCLVTLEQLNNVLNNYTLAYNVRTVKALELVCGNSCYEMYISGLAGAYESAGGVDPDGDRVDVDSLLDHAFDFCDRGADGELCAVKIFKFFESQGNASDSCPFGGYGSSGSSYESSGEPGDSSGLDSGGLDSGGDDSYSGGDDSYSGGDGLGSSYELPDDVNFDDFVGLNESSCTDGCKKFVASFVQAAGCCVGSLFQSLYPVEEFTSTDAFHFFQNECGNEVPDPCSAQGLIEGTLFFDNLDINFVRTHEQDFRDYIRLDLAFSLSIDKDNIKITFLKETNSFRRHLMAAGVSVGYSIVTSDVDARNRVAEDLTNKIKSGRLNLASINSLPTAARIDPSKEIGITQASTVTLKTRAVVQNRSAAATLTAFPLSAVLLLLASLFLLA